jgi:hypothetical protein
MAYIGKQPVVGNFVKLDAITTSATTTFNLLNGGVSYFPQTANNCIVSLNGVIQSPTSAYTISGSTIIFSDALTSSDTIDFILVLGDVLSIGTPSDGTITSAKLASGTDGLFAWQSVQTTGFTAVAARAYPCNTTSAAFTVTLPASPSIGDQVLLLDYAGTFATNNLTVNPNSLKIQTQTGNRIFNTSRLALTFTYVDSTQGWVLSSGYLESTNPFYVAPYSVDFLVIAGGGGGGGTGTHSGGGGAGGYRTSTQTVTAGTAITITVGDGGAYATNGSNSSISGSGLSTITSAGGGCGKTPAIAGNGGSGGGSGGAGNTVGGTGNTPSTSPSQGNNGGSDTYAGPNYGCGGGGGAGAVGGNGTTTAGGNGGAGTASSITGSSVTRAGGGGGNTYDGGTAGSGGTGGGGAAGPSGPGYGGTPGVAGTANTGGGGGGGSGTSAGSGGKGVVILSVPTASYSSTTTGSPTVTTSGSNTILQFNGSGSYTT